ncbi:MAG: FGGY-family carbohydrate kinase, partial [Clostridia bacterium]
GAPNWDSDARAMLVGMTRATNKNHLVRAGLTSIAFCTKQLLEEMKKGGYEIKEIRCDGGVSKNQFLMQFQSDLLETDLRLPKNSESTVMGVVYMCGLAFGVFKSLKQISSFWEEKAKFVPQKNLKAKKEYKKWKKAVKLCMLWR